MLPIKIEIPHFIRQVKLSNKQLPLYFHWTGECIKGKTKNLPISFYKDKNNIPDKTKIEHLKDEYVVSSIRNNVVLTTTRFTEFLPLFNELNDKKIKGIKYILCKQENGHYVPIISNSKKVGKPKFILINGQLIYSGLNDFSRGIMMEAIKSSFKPYLENLPVIDIYPLKIECEWYDTIRNVYGKSKEGTGHHWDIDNVAYPYMKAFPDTLLSLGKIKDDDRLHLTIPPHPIFCPIDNHNDRKLIFIISHDNREIIEENSIYQELKKMREEQSKIITPNIPF